MQEIRCEGLLGFAHDGECADVVCDDVRSDFPELEVTQETVTHLGAHRVRDQYCLGCGEPLTAKAARMEGR